MSVILNIKHSVMSYEVSVIASYPAVNVHIKNDVIMDITSHYCDSCSSLNKPTLKLNIQARIALDAGEKRMLKHFEDLRAIACLLVLNQHHCKQETLPALPTLLCEPRELWARASSAALTAWTKNPRTNLNYTRRRIGELLTFEILKKTHQLSSNRDNALVMKWIWKTNIINKVKI